MKCVNCDKQALWTWAPAHTDALSYCEECLPSFLYPLKNAGLLDTTEYYTELQDQLAALLVEEPVATPTVRRKRQPRTSVNTEVTDEGNSDPS